MTTPIEPGAAGNVRITSSGTVLRLYDPPEEAGNPVNSKLQSLLSNPMEPYIEMPLAQLQQCAAEPNNLYAKLMLAGRYETGLNPESDILGSKGFGKDPDKALRLYQEAAALDPLGQYYLGTFLANRYQKRSKLDDLVFLFSGKHIATQQDIEAAAWLIMAAEQGVQQANSVLRQMNLTAGAIRKAKAFSEQLSQTTRLTLRA